MKKHLRVVLVVVSCLLSVLLVGVVSAAPTQNFGPRPSSATETETAKAPAPVVTKAPKAAAPAKVEAPKPEAPKAVAAADSAELSKLRGELDAARAESKKSASRVADLEKENHELGAKLTTTEKKADALSADAAELKSARADLDKARAESAQLKKQVSAKPAVDPGEVKRLEVQLGDARQEAEQARKKSDARIHELEKQNSDLSTKLAATPAEAPDARIMKRLRDENSYLRNLLDTYTAKNPELKGQLRRYEQTAKQ